MSREYNLDIPDGSEEYELEIVQVFEERDNEPEPRGCELETPQQKAALSKRLREGIRTILTKPIIEPEPQIIQVRA